MSVFLRSVHAKEPHQVLQHFNTDEATGISSQAADAAQRQHGFNELPPDKPPNFSALVVKQFDDLLVKILLAAAAVDLLVAFLEGDTSVTAFVEPFVILLILVANAIVGVVTETNAEAAIAALKEYEADTATCLRDGQLLSLPVREVVPGDILEVAAGAKVPADCYMLSKLGANVTVDQSMITGESGNVGKYVGPVVTGENVVVQDKHNVLLSGTMVTAGRARCIVVGTGGDTAMGRIKESLSVDEDDKTPLKIKLDEFGTFLSKVIAAICIAVWLVNIPHFSDPAYGSWLQGAVYYFKIAVALAVAAIPEGLPAVVTTCLALGTRKMARQNAIVRSLPSVETLGCTTVICVDKTGTLTTNAMTVTRAAVPTSLGISSYSVHGPTASRIGRITPDGSSQPLAAPAEVQGLLYLALCSSLCNDSVLSMEGGMLKGLGDSSEVALGHFSERVGLPKQAASTLADGGLCSVYWKEAYQRLGTLDFDRQRKMMSVSVVHEGKNLIFTKGAPEVLLRHCKFAIDEAGQASTELSVSVRGAWEALLQRWSADSALRCLALAYGSLPDGQSEVRPEDENGLVFLGAVGLKDPPRPEAEEAVHRCKAAGIRVLMLTGDNKGTADAVARQVGILGADVTVSGLIDDDHAAPLSLTAAEFDKLTPSDQQRAARHLSVMARVEPHHKRQLVEILKLQKEVVAMTGDGVNDAPALRKADIGIAMGSGTAVARHAADMVLADDNFATIVAAVSEGRCIFTNAKQFIRYMVSSNIGEVFAIFSAALLGLPSTLTPVQLLWVNLVTDGLPATALSFNKADRDVMRAQPRKPSDSIVGQWLFARYLIIGIYVGAVTVAAFLWWFLAFPGGPRMSWHDLRHSQTCVDAPFDLDPRTYRCSVFQDLRPSTMSMTVLVVVEMFNALNALSENGSLLSHPPWRNLWLLGAICTSMLLHAAILYLPFLTTVFGVTALSWEEWRVVILLSAPVVLIDEALKAISRSLEDSGRTAWNWQALLRSWGAPRNFGRYAVFASPTVEREKLRER